MLLQLGLVAQRAALWDDAAEALRSVRQLLGQRGPAARKKRLRKPRRREPQRASDADLPPAQAIRLSEDPPNSAPPSIEAVAQVTEDGVSGPQLKPQLALSNSAVFRSSAGTDAEEAANTASAAAEGVESSSLFFAREGTSDAPSSDRRQTSSAAGYRGTASSEADRPLRYSAGDDAGGEAGRSSNAVSTTSSSSTSSSSGAALPPPPAERGVEGGARAAARRLASVEAMARRALEEVEANLVLVVALE